MNSTTEAAIYILIGTLISTIGAWITARIGASTEKPTESLSVIIRELRTENDDLQKDKNNLEAVALKRELEHKENIGLLRRERDRYASNALALRRLLQIHAPHVDVPDLDNGTPPQNEKVK